MIFINNLEQELSNCSPVSLDLNESIDINDNPQPSILVRYVSNNLEVVEAELLDLVTLKEITMNW